MDYVFGKYVLGLLLFMKLLDIEGDDCVLGINLFIYIFICVLLKILFVKNVNFY